MKLPSFCSIIFRVSLRTKCGNPSFCISFALALYLLGISGFSSASQSYGPIQLKQEVLEFLNKEYGAVEHEHLEITVGNLDRRLRIRKCSRPLELDPQDNTGLGGNISVRASCKSKQSWAIHIPAQVYIYRQIPVAKHNLTRGDIVSNKHLQLESVNISLIRQAFISQSSGAIGQEVKRSIYQGTPLKSANLQAPTSIRRGENVAISAKMGGIKVNSAGTALSDGRLGENIRVRNNQSKRIISGLVVASGEVQIN